MIYPYPGQSLIVHKRKGSFAGDGYVPWQKTRWD